MPLATRSIWLFSKKAEATPPPTPTPTPLPETLVPEPVVPVPTPAPVAATPPPTPVAADDAVTQVAALPQSDTLDTLAALAPLQYGDLTALGLAGWSPAGLSSWLLELVNVSTGLPWFYTIVAGTLLSRLLLLPFSVKQLRNSAALAPHQPRLLELKEELNRAYKTGDKIGVQRVALKQRRALPLEQLHWSGVSFLPDLTVPDPFYVLPIAAAVLMNVQLAVRASMVHAECSFSHTDVPFHYHRLVQATWLRPRTARQRLT